MDTLDGLLPRQAQDDMIRFVEAEPPKPPEKPRARDPKPARVAKARKAMAETKLAKKGKPAKLKAKTGK